MHVLMPEAHSPGAQAAAEGLRAAGHTVSVCHPSGHTGPWCAALVHGRCPLETTPVDAAVVVRPAEVAGFLPFEAGVVCAVRRLVPLVVAGEIDPFSATDSGTDHPYRTWAAAEQYGTDVTETVEAVVHAPLPRHSAVASAAVRDTLRTHGFDPGGSSAEVCRREGGLLIRMIEPVPGIDDKVMRRAAVRACGAVRQLDRWARGIDVTIQHALANG